MLPIESTAELLRRIAATLEIMPSAESVQILLPHLVWELCQILERIDPLKDLLPAELLVLLAVLVPAHSRSLLASPGFHDPTKRFLKVVR